MIESHDLSSRGWSARAAGAAALLLTSLPAWSLAADAAASPAPSQSAPELRLQEVIVTASRRAENVQKESRPIAVLSGAALDRAGVSSAESLNTLVPGLSVASSGDILQLYIRGVGDPTVGDTTDPAVAFNYDGVYLPRSYEQALTLFDTDRLEVVKGPQGTLYGRNATAGAMNVIPNLPDFNFGGYLEAEGGNYGEHMFTGAVNLPLSSTVALRASFQTNNHNGYLSDGTDDADSQAGRLQLLIKPGDVFSARFDLAYSHDGGRGEEPVVLPLENSGNPWMAAANPTLNKAITGPPFFLIPVSPDIHQNVDTLIALAHFDWHFSGATLTVIPAYVSGSQSSSSFAGLILTQGQGSSKQSSLEVRLASSDSGAALVPGLQWVTGVYASHEHVSDWGYAEEGAVLGNAISTLPQLNDTTWAGFGEGKYTLLPGLRLIAGARYTREQEDARGSNTVDPNGVFTSPSATTGYWAGSLAYSKVNYRAGLEYDLTPESMAYFTVSTGFKAGGFYGAPPPNTYQPEQIKAYELGIKNRFLDDRLQANFELFDWDYTDLQEQFLSLISDGSVVLVTKNAANSTLRGADVDLSALLTHADRFSIDGEFNSAKYNNYQFDTVFLGPPVTGCIATTSPADHLNCSGFQLVKAPLWTAMADYQHTFALHNGSGLLLDVQQHYSSAYWLTDNFSPAEHAPGWTMTDVVLSYDFVGTPLTLSGYVNNLENRAVYNYAVQSPAAPTLAVADISPPRTYGVRIRYTF